MNKELNRIAVTLAGCSIGACAPPLLQIPTIPYLREWNGNTLTVCCEKTNPAEECSPRHWTETVQTHCSGRAKALESASKIEPADQTGRVSECLSYSCDGEIRPFVSGNCSPALHRRVGVHVVADPSYTKLSDWKANLYRAFSNTNWYFKEFGISFEIKKITQASLGGSEKKLDDAIFQALEKYKETVPADIQLGMLSKNFRGSWLVTRLGQSVFLKDLLVVNGKYSDLVSSVLVHELGHTFGAFHSYVSSSIMAPMASARPWLEQFDPASKQVIRITKCADFNKGLGSLTTTQIRQIGDIFAAATRPEDVNPIVFAFEQQIMKSEERKDEKGAIFWANRAITLQPEHPYSHCLLGWVYIDFERYEKAKEIFEKAEKLSIPIPHFSPSKANPEADEMYFRAYALVGLGDAVRNLGDPTRAASLYNQAIRDGSKYSGGYTGLGYLALEAGQFDEAIKRFNKALSVNPGSIAAKRGLEKAKEKSKS